MTGGGVIRGMTGGGVTRGGVTGGGVTRGMTGGGETRGGMTGGGVTGGRVTGGRVTGGRVIVCVRCHPQRGVTGGRGGTRPVSVASCAGRGGPTGRTTFHSGHIGTACRPCASGSDASTRPNARTSTDSRPTYSCKASPLSDTHRGRERLQGQPAHVQL